VIITAPLSSRRGNFLTWCSRVFVVVGISLIACYAYVWADGRIYESAQAQRFGSDPALERAPAECAGAPVETADSAIGRLEITRLGLSVIVQNRDDPRHLRRGAGLVPGSALPGSTGNLVIAAHRDTFFRSLRNIQKDDLIQLTTEDYDYVYRVQFTRVVSPEHTEVVASGAEPTLTLITCFPFYYVGPAPERFIVRARQVSAQSRKGSTECVSPRANNLNPPPNGAGI
jgi:sortase A